MKLIPVVRYVIGALSSVALAIGLIELAAPTVVPPAVAGGLLVSGSTGVYLLGFTDLLAER